MDKPQRGLGILWDFRKARSQLRKYEVSFEEAADVLGDFLHHLFRPFSFNPRYFR